MFWTRFFWISSKFLWNGQHSIHPQRLPPFPAVSNGRPIVVKGDEGDFLLPSCSCHIGSRISVGKHIESMGTQKPHIESVSMKLFLTWKKLHIPDFRRFHLVDSCCIGVKSRGHQCRVGKKKLIYGFDGFCCCRLWLVSGSEDANRGGVHEVFHQHLSSQEHGTKTSKNMVASFNEHITTFRNWTKACMYIYIYFKILKTILSLSIHTLESLDRIRFRSQKETIVQLRWSFKGQLGVPLTYVYPWYLLCSLGILGDYNP